MGRSVDFRDYTDCSNFGIVNNGFDVLWRNEASDAAILAELWDSWNLHWECIFVHNMPMQNIEFRV